MESPVIKESKFLLHTEEGRRLLSFALFQPTEEKITARSDQYAEDKACRIFFALVHDVPVGLCILKETENIQEILILSVSPPFRRQGIGRAMMHFLRVRFPDSPLIAETDDDAVDFYRRCGFNILSLGEIYPGVTRYTCTLQKEEYS